MVKCHNGCFCLLFFYKSLTKCKFENDLIDRKGAQNASRLIAVFIIFFDFNALIIYSYT